MSHPITALVAEARSDLGAADALTRDYLPFIKSEVSKFTGRSVSERDDEVSIAMLAFHEAITTYDEKRGAFIPFAALIMRNRLIDNARHASRQVDTVSLQAPVRSELSDETTTIEDHVASPDDHAGEYETREATRQEIEELQRQLAEFEVSFADVADNSPSQARTLGACKEVLEYALSQPELLEEFHRTKKLPIGRLASGSGVSRKTMERHRKYLVALLCIWSNGYEIIRGHLYHVLKRGETA